jgi:hypothetical protein
MVSLASFIIDYPTIQAVFITMYAVKMWFYMPAYKDDFWLTEYAAVNSTDSWFAWHVKALKRWEAGSHQEAVILWTMARALSPKEFKILWNLHVLMRMAKHNEEGEKLLAEAEQNIPKGQEIPSKKLIDEAREGKLAIII